MKKIGTRGLYAGLALSVALPIIGATIVHAQQNKASDFGLQVTPSPIVETLKPGVKQNIEFQIKNTGSQEEKLKVDLRSFSFDANTGEVKLQNDVPKEVSDWVTFADPTFSVRTGESFTERMAVNTPASAGFTYSFAIVIHRAQVQKAETGKTSIEGSVAVFTLLSVDRPGSDRKFSILQFSSSKHLYEYLPASFTLKVKNTGNTLVKPSGNVFIQRSSKGNPISVLLANPTGSYLLPGMTRDIKTTWNDGFPVYQTVQDAANTSSKQHLTWNWSKAQQFRFGKYTARVVAIYNDGQRDIPVETEITFWVMPWKLMLIILVIIIVAIVGLIAIARNMSELHKLRRRVMAGKNKDKDEKETED